MGETEETKIPYPKSIPFILTTEFCERFSYYGMRAILVLFLSNILGYSETDSSVVFHGFTVLAYLTPILGAILADSFIGKFNTIFYVSILYAVGQVVITISSAGDEKGEEGLDKVTMTALLYTGLLMVGAGTGGIKPCVATFGGDQFKLPEQKKQSELFFSIFYWAVNLGSFLSMVITPQLRSGVSCLGQESCYPLAFGVPAVLMFVAVTIFFIGRVFKMYKINMPDRTQENLIKKTLRCIWKSIWAEKVPGEKHWLDRGRPEFGPFADDVKAVWNVMIMMLPFPIFWALFDQQGSRWTFQATRMNGNFFGIFRLEPDNIQVANAVLILVLIPLFNSVIYPVLAKCNLLKTSLQRIGVGFFCAALSFGVSGILDLQLEKTYPNLPVKGTGQLQFYGLYPEDLDCNISVSFYNGDKIKVQSAFVRDGIPDPVTLGYGGMTLNINDDECPNFGLNELNGTQINVNDTQSSSFYFWIDETQNKIQLEKSTFFNQIEKPTGGRPMVKVLWANILSNDAENTLTFQRKDKEKKTEISLNGTIGDTDPEEGVVGKPGDYYITINDQDHSELVNLKQGANYNYLIVGNTTFLHQVTPESSVSMFWQIPQYFIMTCGEILFSVSTMEFCFTQAPVSMKAITLALRYLTNAIGNVIDIVVMKALEGVLPKQAYEFFLFSGLTLVFMAIFTLMSITYKYVDYTNTEKEKEEKGTDNDAMEDE